MTFFLRRQFFYTQDPKQQRRFILKPKPNKEDLAKLERKDPDSRLVSPILKPNQKEVNKIIKRWQESDSSGLN